MSDPELPELPTKEQERTVPKIAEQPIPKNEVVNDLPKIDYNDPAQRFQLLSLARFKKTIQARVIDLKTQEQLKVTEGEMLADSGYQIARIDMAKSTIYLRGPHLDTVALRLVKRSAY